MLKKGFSAGLKKIISLKTATWFSRNYKQIKIFIEQTAAHSSTSLCHSLVPLAVFSFFQKENKE